MNAFGIEFRHRRPNDSREFVAQDFAQFTAFAALVHAHGYAKHVRSVFYDTAIHSFIIDADPAVERLLADGCIDYCADATLSQYFLFDRCGHKGELEGME